MIEELRRLVNGYQVSRAIQVVATLGIPDLLADGPRSSDELASTTRSHPDALYRVLRAVAAVGVLREEEGRRFALAELGHGLRSDAEESLHGWATFVGREYHWNAWAHLGDSVRTGENAFRLANGVGVWEYRAERPEENEIFDRAMTSMTGIANRAILAAYDFDRFGTLVDVGGGRGTLLAALLDAYPGLHGVLFDQPHVVDGVDLGERARVVAGSFFDEVPSGGDAYLLKSILHDWEDDEAVAILRACRRAAADGATLLVVEQDLRTAAAMFTDLNMLVMPGGRERTRDEYAALLARGGFRLSGATPAGDTLSILEATPG